jgi:hypothetical protein
MNTNTDNTMQNTQLDGMYRMASKFLGYTGPKTREALEQFRASSPAVAAKMKRYSNAMAKGGLMRKGYATGGTASGPDPFITNQPTLPTEPKLKDIPKDATDAKKKRIEEENQAKLDEYKRESMAALSKAQQNVVMGTMTPYRPEVDEISETAGQIIPGTAGQVTGAAPTVTAAQAGGAALAGPTMMAPTAQTTTALTEPQVAATLAGIDAAQGQVSSDAQVAAATQATSSVSNLQAAQGTAIMMNNPVQRQIEAGELVSGAANAATAAAFTEQVQAAEATPSKKATVAGQLEGLMQQFDNGQTPPWAAGAMRSAMQTLSARGLGASSMAGQAVIQATMEAALPIAQMDAATQAQFESQNLSNRQQRAMLAAQQRAEFLGQEFDQAFQARVANAARIADVANMNFTAEQQVALENSRLANTMQLENLNNRQAVVIAEASALANMDLSNLNNRQQAAVQNAQSFLQMDMANLSNAQQTNMFKAQQNLQALFTDQAAINAAAQFNASSENQTNQFFANLMAQTDQFNASQYNAMNQFDVEQANAISTFNSELQQQRDLFNAQNSLVVEQANAQWRQNLATLNNAANNEANMALAQTLNALSMSNVEQIWQRERDLMSYSIQTANNNADRATQIALQKLANEASASTAAASKSAAFASAAGSIVSSIIFG